MSGRLIYLIAHRETEAAWKSRNISFTPSAKPADYHKIGVSNDVENRLSMLKSGTPHKLELVTTIESDDPEAVEKELHRIYSFSHQSGEWYKLTSNAINSLIALDEIQAGFIQEIGGYQPDWLVNGSSLYVEYMNEVSDDE